MKVGTVALIGRPNTGKSTLVNNLVGQKVAITSPKPQTTQFPIYAVYQDPEHQIIFVDTPGIFAAKDAKVKKVNIVTQKALNSEVDILLYLVDHTRQRGYEENRILGIVRKVSKPKILVINKIDKLEPSFRAQYKFLEDEFDKTVEVSALKGTNLPLLMSEIFSHLHEGEKVVERSDMALPAIGISSKQYIEELIREKAFLKLRDELPYSVRVIVDEITERENNMLYIKARLLTTADRYKKMIIGKEASRIKVINMMARKELEVATGKKVYLELTVEVE